VTTEDGTGIVHTAVMYGEDDYNVGIEMGLPAVHTVGQEGKFLDIAPEFLRGRFVKSTDKDIIEDLIVDSEEGLNLCKSSLKTISNIRNYYNIMMSTRINRTITVLTLFTIFLSVFTAVSGFYGMNVALPFQNVPFISIYIFVFSLFLGSIFLIFAKFKWL